MTKDWLLTFGVFLIFLGIFLITLYSFYSSKENTRVEFAIGGFIGPIPFGFATQKELLVIIIMLSMVALIIFLLSYKIQ